MSYHQISRIFYEYPFLRDYFRRETIYNASVARWNDEMLNADGMGSSGDSEYPEITYFFNKEGNLIDRHPRRFSLKDRSTWWSVNSYFVRGLASRPRLTVGEFLERMGPAAKQIFWVVQNSSCYVGQTYLTLYKPIPGYSNVADWLDAIKAGLPPGTTVKTTRENVYKTWTPDARTPLQWGVQGEIVTKDDAGAMAYQVKHPDGSVGHYDRSEFKVV